MAENPQASLEDRRRRSRLPLNLRVLYQHHGDAWLVEAQTENVSAEGAFVRTHRPPLPVGTNVVVALRLTETDEPLMIRGTVTWIREEEAERGMGLQFDQLEPEDDARLRALLDAES